MECKGCKRGVEMCYHRPCMGSPEEFEAIIDAGFADKLRIDFWYGHHGVEPLTDEEINSTTDPELKQLLKMLKELKGPIINPHKDNVEFLCGGTEYDKNFRANFSPTGKCKLLTDDDLCSLHDLGLKPDQGQKSCCNDDKNEAANSNLPYVNLWTTDKGKEVIEKFKKAVGIDES